MKRSTLVGSPAAGRPAPPAKFATSADFAAESAEIDASWRAHPTAAAATSAKG